MKLDITELLSGKIRVMPFRYEIPTSGGDAGDRGDRSDREGKGDRSDTGDTGGEELPLPPDGVVFTSPVRVAGKISDSGSCLYLVLDADADFEAPCDRCGEAARGTVSCRLERMVAEEGAVGEDGGEDYFIACEGKLDLDREVMEELMLSFPSQILCREDCLGVCPVCGRNKNRGECGCAAKAAEEIDPRWQALARLLREKKEKGKEE